MSGCPVDPVRSRQAADGRRAARQDSLCRPTTCPSPLAGVLTTSTDLRNIARPMCACTICADCFLRGIHGSDVLLDYCQARQLPFLPIGPQEAWSEGIRRWRETIAALPNERRCRIEREMAAVEAMADRAGVQHLREAAGDERPVTDDSNPVQAVLEMVLHRPELFWEVYYHHEHRGDDVWRAARTTTRPRPPAVRVAALALASALAAFFPASGMAEEAWRVETNESPVAVSFVARRASRTRGDELTADQPECAAPASLQFLYYPDHGTVLLQPAPGSTQHSTGLLDCFSRSVLGAPLQPAPSFTLDQLKYPFHPPPAAPAITSVRVKSLHLRYPARGGRRLLSFDTLTSDSPTAIDDLLQTHVGAESLAHLTVAHAVLQVRVLTDEGRPRTHLIRLWPDRCDLGKGPLGDRMLTCLRRWGL